MNEAGYKVVSYTYDAWGNPYEPVYCYNSGVSAADRANAELNPFRYRGYYYDSETGYYYLQTRYYNPEWGRFLNADGYVNANGDILGYNMFAYCGNNPTGHTDPNGQSWSDLLDWLKDAWKDAKQWVKDTFGASHSVSATSYNNVNIYPSWSYSPITVETGLKQTVTQEVRGSSSKPFSVYIEEDVKHPVKSSTVGYRRNFWGFSIDRSLGFDNMGTTVSYTNDNQTVSVGLTANLSELKVGVIVSSTVQEGNVNTTSYTEVSGNVWLLIAAVAYATSGITMPSPTYTYGS